MFVIEKGVPLPVRGRGGQRGESKYPWASMNVGDSFTVPAAGPTKTGRQDKAQNALSTAARSWSLKAGKPDFRVSTRLIDEKTVRCWRVS